LRVSQFSIVSIPHFWSGFNITFLKLIVTVKIYLILGSDACRDTDFTVRRLDIIKKVLC
jgi:hypothetical protein